MKMETTIPADLLDLKARASLKIGGYLGHDAALHLFMPGYIC